MDGAKLARINELARAAKERTLTPAELAERDALRREYVDAVKRNLRAQLEQIELVDGDGNRRKLGKSSNKREN